MAKARPHSVEWQTDAVVHVLFHEKKKPNKEICDYGCSEKGTMNNHVARVHEKKNPFQCEICDYSVVSKRKPFQYEICIKMHHSVLRWFAKEKKAVVAKVLAKKLTRREKSC